MANGASASIARPILHLSIFFTTHLLSDPSEVSAVLCQMCSLACFAITVACYQPFIVKMCGLFFSVSAFRFVVLFLAPCGLCLCRFSVPLFCFLHFAAVLSVVSLHCFCFYPLKHESSWTLKNGLWNAQKLELGGGGGRDSCTMYSLSVTFPLKCHQ